MWVCGLSGARVGSSPGSRSPAASDSGGHGSPHRTNTMRTHKQYPPEMGGCGFVACCGCVGCRPLVSARRRRDPAARRGATPVGMAAHSAQTQCALTSTPHLRWAAARLWSVVGVWAVGSSCRLVAGIPQPGGERLRWAWRPTAHQHRPHTPSQSLQEGLMCLRVCVDVCLGVRGAARSCATGRRTPTHAPPRPRTTRRAPSSLSRAACIPARAPGPRGCVAGAVLGPCCRGWRGATRRGRRVPGGSPMGLKILLRHAQTCVMTWAWRRTRSTRRRASRGLQGPVRAILGPQEGFFPELHHKGVPKTLQIPHPGSNPPSWPADKIWARSGQFPLRYRAGGPGVHFVHCRARHYVATFP
jgi:hypothetical protein